MPGAYAAGEMDEDDDDSSSMTSSDNGSDALDMPDLSRMNDTEAAEQLFYQYRKARRTWRRFTGKPVRRFRRDFKKNFYKRGKGKGHPRGRGRGPTRGLFFTNDDVQVFLKGRGKGNRAQTFGKGHGRCKNPKGRDGEIMKCRICNSDEHLMAKCPNNPQGHGRGASSSSAPTSFAGVTNPPASGTRDGEHALNVADNSAAPPWADDVFDAPSDAFPASASHFVQPITSAAFMMASSSNSGDPLRGEGDPWANYGNLTFGFPQRNPFASAQPPPVAAQSVPNPFSMTQQRIDTPPAQRSRPPSASGAAEHQRVAPEDELSDSREEDATSARRPPRDYTTPVPLQPTRPVGVFAPLYRRSGPHSISEQQLHRVLQSQEITPQHSLRSIGRKFVRL